jgi:hypothetical protein
MRLVWIRLVWVLGSALVSLYGQTCTPAPMMPAGVVAGTLGNSSCQLADGTAYAAYRLDLAARGAIALDLTTANDLVLILRDAGGTRMDAGTSIHRRLEAGSYTVLVDGRAAGQVGDYSLRSVFTPEPGLLCASFPRLGTAQSATGLLGASSCRSPDDSLYEGYWLRTFGAGSLTVTVTSSDFTPTVTVRSGDGVAVATGDGAVTAAVDGDSRYEIVVSSEDQSGAFQITTAFETSEGESCRAVKTLSDTAQDSGTVSAGGCATTIADGGDTAYYNYYAVTVGAAGVADLAASSDDFAPLLYLLDEAGNRRAADSGGGVNGASEIRMQLRPGNYVVQVFSLAPAGGSYQLSYQFVAGDPARCGTAELHAGDSAAGTLTASSCRTASGLADLYRVTLDAAGTLDLTLAGDTLAATLEIRDEKENLIVANGDFDGTGVTSLSAELPAGTYLVAAGAASGAGAYRMTSQFAAHELAACTYVQPVASDGGYIHRLGAGSCAGANGQPVDWYEFTLAADGTAAAFMTSSEVSGFLTLTDAAGIALRSDRNSYDGARDPMIVEYLAAGTYRLAARAAGSRVAGLYQVDVRNTAGPRPPLCRPRSTVAMGATVSGTIGYTGCPYTGGTFADIYGVQLSGSTTVDVRLASGDFDAYLYLLDAKGNLVDQDDDSGGNTDARITRLLPAGTYFVVATPAGDYTKGGSYRLSVGQAQ